MSARPASWFPSLRQEEIARMGHGDFGEVRASLLFPAFNAGFLERAVSERRGGREHAHPVDSAIGRGDNLHTQAGIRQDYDFASVGNAPFQFAHQATHGCGLVSFADIELAVKQISKLI